MVNYDSSEILEYLLKAISNEFLSNLTDTLITNSIYLCHQSCL